MDDFKEVLADPIWWFTAVLTGVSMSIAGVYVVRLVDMIMSKLSTSWRRSSDGKKIEEEKRIERLSWDANIYTILNLNEIRYLHHSTGSMLLGIIALLFLVLTPDTSRTWFGDTLSYSLACLLFVTGFREFLKSLDSRLEATRAYVLRIKRIAQDAKHEQEEDGNKTPTDESSTPTDDTE